VESPYARELSIAKSNLYNNQAIMEENCQFDSPPSSPLNSSPFDPDDECARDAGDLLPSEPITPVQNIVTLRLKKLMAEKKLKPRVENADVGEIDLDDDSLKSSPIKKSENSFDAWVKKTLPKTPPTIKKKSESLCLFIKTVF
jgi:hypothetical protein